MPVEFDSSNLCSEPQAVNLEELGLSCVRLAVWQYSDRRRDVEVDKIFKSMILVQHEEGQFHCKLLPRGLLVKAIISQRFTRSHGPMAEVETKLIAINIAYQEAA